MLFPCLKTDLGLNDTQCGSLVSAVYWSIVLFTIPVSILIDRWSRKRSVGAPLGGLAADAWMKRRTNARLLLGGLLTVAYVSAASAVTQDVVHPGPWAVSCSICVVVQNLLGSSIRPIFVGALSDRYQLSAALLAVPAFSAFGGVLFLLRRLRKWRWKWSDEPALVLGGGPAHLLVRRPGLLGLEASLPRPLRGPRGEPPLRLHHGPGDHRAEPRKGYFPVSRLLPGVLHRDQDPAVRGDAPGKPRFHHPPAGIGEEIE